MPKHAKQVVRWMVLLLIPVSGQTAWASDDFAPADPATQPADVQTAHREQPAGGDATAVNEPAVASVDQSKEAAEADENAMVCRKETPTGSHRTIRVCRPKKDIEAGNKIVQREMNRFKHYANPTVTPGD